MMVFGKAGLVFLSVPKTGSTAYQSALAPLADIVISNPPELKHAPVYRYNRYFRPPFEKFIPQPLALLAVMREPIDWLGSWYRYRARDEMTGHPNSTAGVSFDDFVSAYLKGQRPGFADVGAQSRFLATQKNGAGVTHLFRYDDQAGLQAFLSARLGPLPAIERQNESPAQPLRLSPEVEMRLRRKMAEEFALYHQIEAGGAYQPPPDWPPLAGSSGAGMSRQTVLKTPLNDHG